MPQTIFVLDETAAAKIAALEGKMDQLLAKIDKPESESDMLDFGFIRVTDVLKIFPVGATTWWKWVREGYAPKGVKLGGKVVAWSVDDIRAFAQKVKTEGMEVVS